jgi:hypothetical protein
MCEVAVIVFDAELKLVGDGWAVARNETPNQHQGGFLVIEASQEIA